MVKTLPITDAREQLTTLVDKADRLLDEYVITVNGKPKAVIVSAAEYDSWKETNEILADRELVKSIRQAEQEEAEGKTIPWEEFKKEMGW
ncbi:MAG: type II toxin-antitoxin system Phd/YefM family antitoxin [Patescibacteria group bacterium]